MRRTGFLFDAVCSRDNFRRAWTKAVRGKQRKPEVLAWYRDLDIRLEALRTSVADGSDVRKYFDSIDHGVLKTRLRRIIADPPVIGMLDAIIDSYETSPGKGLPIGNLTSQYFANHYLGALDHQVKERDRIGPWVRYMDDMLAFADNPEELRAVYLSVVAWCDEALHLTLKPAIVGTVIDGVPFLGFLLKPEGIQLTRKTKQRFSRKAIAIDHEMRHGTIAEKDAGDRITAMVAHVSLARSRVFRYHVFNGRGLGDEPRESRRELEQRRVERAFGQSQQEHSRQPEQ